MSLIDDWGKLPVQIRSIQIDPDSGSVSLDYIVLPDDVRAQGRLIQTRNMTVAVCDEYADELEALMAAALELLADVREDFSRTAAVVLPEDDLGDDVGMGE